MKSYALLPVLNAGFVFGIFAPGFLGDKISRFRNMLTSLKLRVTTVLGL